MSIHVVKSPTEFRHPPTVQRNNKGGLSKYIANRRSNNVKDWDVRTLSMAESASKKSPLVLLPRSIVKLERKLPKSIPALPISNDVLSSLPNCKISSFRLTSERNSVIEKGNTALTSVNSLIDKSELSVFKDNSLMKPMCVNQNNNVSNNILKSTNSLTTLISQEHLFVRNSISTNLDKKKLNVQTEEEEDDEEDDSLQDVMEIKPPLSPILSAPTTIRFPAQTPEKDRSSSGDSGSCQWDKCEAVFESSGCLLEHLQVRTYIYLAFLVLMPHKSSAQLSIAILSGLDHGLGTRHTFRSNNSDS